MKKVLHDVVVTLFIYNQEKHIKYAIESIFNQTVFPKTFYIFDDASSDKTATIIEEILLTAPEGLNIKFVQNKKNIGLSLQLNKLKNQFKDTLIIVQAGDDYSYSLSQ